jgi:hypothetical protein
MTTFILKIIGFTVACGAATFGLLGETNKRGKLTRRGRYVLILLLLGFTTSVFFELVSEFEKRELKKQAIEKELIERRLAEQKEILLRKRERIDRLWSIQLKQPIVGLFFRLYLFEGLSPKDFVNTANEIDIEIYSFPKFTRDGIGSRHLRWSFDKNEKNAEKAIKLSFVTEINKTLAFFPKVALSKIYPSIPMWEMSVDHDWTDPTIIVGGVLVRADWSITELKLNLVENISSLRWLSVRTSNKFDWNKIHECKLYLYIAGKSNFEIDIKKLEYLKSSDHTISPAWTGKSAHIEGIDILEMWRKDFISAHE